MSYDNCTTWEDEPRRPKPNNIERARAKQYAQDRELGLKLAPIRTGTNLPERFIENSYGNHSFTQLETPEGMTAEHYCRCLKAQAKYAYPKFSVEGNVVIEEMYYSIGD